MYVCLYITFIYHVTYMCNTKGGHSPGRIMGWGFKRLRLTFHTLCVDESNKQINRFLLTNWPCSETESKWNFSASFVSIFSDMKDDLHRLIRVEVRKIIGENLNLILGSRLYRRLWLLWVSSHLRFRFWENMYMSLLNWSSLSNYDDNIFLNF